MAYTAPTITGSSAALADLKGGASGHLEKLIGANTFTANQTSMIRAFKNGNGQDVYNRYVAAIRNYIEGDPVAQASAKQYVLDFNVVMAALSAMAAEAGVLVDANAGTLTTVAWGAGLRKSIRSI